MFAQHPSLLVAWLSLLVGGLGAIPTAGEPPLKDAETKVPKDVYLRAVVSDTAVLRDTLKLIEDDPERHRHAVKVCKAVALMIARYADALGDDALKAQALLVAREIGAGDWKSARRAAEQLAKPGADPKHREILKAPWPTLTVEEVAAPFRLRKAPVYGLNIHSDLMGQLKKLTDVEAVELLAVRTLVLAEYLSRLPANVGDKQYTRREWDRWCGDLTAAATQLAVETGKGKQADRDKLTTSLRSLYLSCRQCHASID